MRTGRRFALIASAMILMGSSSVPFAEPQSASAATATPPYREHRRDWLGTGSDRGAAGRCR